MQQTEERKGAEELKITPCDTHYNCMQLLEARGILKKNFKRSLVTSQIPELVVFYEYSKTNQQTGGWLVALNLKKSRNFGKESFIKGL